MCEYNNASSIFICFFLKQVITAFSSHFHAAFYKTSHNFSKEIQSLLALITRITRDRQRRYTGFSLLFFHLTPVNHIQKNVAD